MIELHNLLGMHTSPSPEPIEIQAPTPHRGTESVLLHFCSLRKWQDLHMGKKYLTLFLSYIISSRHLKMVFDTVQSR